jgi:hypothetical protein
MDSYAIIITILSCLCILVVVYLIAKRIKEEHFQDQTFDDDETCNFTYTDEDTQAQCKLKCYETDGCDVSCQTRCEAAERSDPCLDPNGMTVCNINSVTDIDGGTQEQCVRNCSANTLDCTGCSQFKIFDPITGRTLQGKYTDGKETPMNAINDFKNKCDSSAENHQYCNPCAKACYYCTDPIRCRWLPGSTTADEQQASRNEFRQQSFYINVIPDDRKATIVWTENTSNTIKEYKIFIYKKADVNVDAYDQQQTPLTVRTESLPFNNKQQQSHVIKGLVNGETYSINVNKISNHPARSDATDSKFNYTGPEIISSNTIDIVPSPVTLVNFSSVNRDNTLKQRDLLSVGLLKELTGKTFDISF